MPTYNTTHAHLRPSKTRRTYGSDTSPKKCSGCGEWMPVTEFHQQQCTPDGLARRCKECRREYWRTVEKRRTRTPASGNRAAQALNGVTIGCKKCKECGVMHMLRDFYPICGGRDGHRTKCRFCELKRCAARRARGAAFRAAERERERIRRDAAYLIRDLYGVILPRPHCSGHCQGPHYAMSRNARAEHRFFWRNVRWCYRCAQFTYDVECPCCNDRTVREFQLRRTVDDLYRRAAEAGF